MPGSSDDLKCNLHIGSIGGNNTWEKGSKGMSTLTLGQVGANVCFGGVRLERNARLAFLTSANVKYRTSLRV